MGGGEGANGPPTRLADASAPRPADQSVSEPQVPWEECALPWQHDGRAQEGVMAPGCEETTNDGG